MPFKSALWASSAKKADAKSGERDSLRRDCASVVVVKPLIIAPVSGTMMMPRITIAIKSSISVKPASSRRSYIVRRFDDLQGPAGAVVGGVRLEVEAHRSLVLTGT